MKRRVQDEIEHRVVDKESKSLVLSDSRKKGIFIWIRQYSGLDK